MQPPRFTVSEFIEIANQTLDYAFPTIELEGEVASFKTSQGKWGFFDLKDEQGTISCFIPLFNLHIPLEDGTKLIVLGKPKLTNFGRFSFTVQKLMPIGSGNIKKAFDALKVKLEKEGLFDPAKKRPIPSDLRTIGVVSSITAAGYIDFCKIINNRWGGLTLKVANCGVQGLSASNEIIKAISYFNEQEPVDIIAIVRGGGSKDDLAVFNDEELTRKIASSKIPIITGIGHEIDESLADLAADIRASTPTNAAELLTRDKVAEKSHIHDNIQSLTNYLSHYLSTLNSTNNAALNSIESLIKTHIESTQKDLKNTRQLLDSLNPETVLKQGYAILSGKVSPGNVVKITTYQQIINAKVTDVRPKQ